MSKTTYRCAGTDYHGWWQLSEAAGRVGAGTGTDMIGTPCLLPAHGIEPIRQTRVSLDIANVRLLTRGGRNAGVVMGADTAEAATNVTCVPWWERLIADVVDS